MIDSYYVKGLTGLSLPQGEYVASITFAALGVDDSRKEKENEVFPIPAPVLVLGAPDFSGMEHLVKLMNTPEEEVEARIRVSWDPGPKRVSVEYWIRRPEVRGIITNQPFVLLQETTLGADVSDPDDRYERARMYSADSTVFVTVYVDTTTGRSIRTVWDRQSNKGLPKDRFGRYKRKHSAVTNEELV